MVQVVSDADLRIEYQNLMGADLGSVYYDLYNEVVWLSTKWQEFNEIYGTKDDIALLQDVAPGFFRRIEQILVDDIVLHIARLIDTPKSSGQANLSLRRLLSEITEPALHSQIDLMLVDLDQAASFARRHRHKRLAHRDLSVVLGSVALGSITRDDIDDVIRRMAAVLNRIETWFGKSEIMFEHVIVPPGGAGALKAYMEAGREALRSRRPL